MVFLCWLNPPALSRLSCLEQGDLRDSVMPDALALTIPMDRWPVLPCTSTARARL